jgi:hypothetical protein
MVYFKENQEINHYQDSFKELFNKYIKCNVLIICTIPNLLNIMIDHNIVIYKIFS